MKIAMNNDYSKVAFGTKIPGLTVIARSRGADWLYTYLRTFYIDESRPMGVNNMVFADVGMPLVLWEKQGLQKAVFTTETGTDGNEHHKFEKMEMVQAGSMSTEEYDAYVGDLVNYVVYMAEPVQVERKSLGVKVVIFLVVLRSNCLFVEERILERHSLRVSSLKSVRLDSENALCVSGIWLTVFNLQA